MKRLSGATLSSLPAGVVQPRYDRAKLQTGIVHLGIGAFHRAHMAAYTDDVLNAGDLRWGLLGASLRSPETRDALAPQDGLYTLAIRDASGVKHRVIGAVQRLLVAPEDPQALLSAMAEPSVKIVSLTVTEKGYCLDPATGKLDLKHPDIIHDIANLSRPRSAPGFIIAALKKRKAAGHAPFTVLSCDNLTANGKKVKALLVTLAGKMAPELVEHIASDVACPCSMVDRIVPQTSDSDRAAASAALGLEDKWPIATEPFTQWVIEDDFPQGRPAWEKFGAQMVRDVAPWEAMKLKLLNGAHTSLAFLGSLAGHTYVAEAMHDPVIGRFVAGFMTEDVMPVLAVPEGADVPSYARQLQERFRNPALNHKLEQIASDSSQKIPPRLLGTAQDRLARGLPLGRIAYSIAGFILYVRGVDEKGRKLLLKDPMAAKLHASVAACGGNPGAMARAVLAETSIFGALGSNSDFATAVVAACEALNARGVAASLGVS